jgi:hypothetical protein
LENGEFVLLVNLSRKQYGFYMEDKGGWGKAEVERGYMEVTEMAVELESSVWTDVCICYKLVLMGRWTRQREE